MAAHSAFRQECNPVVIRYDSLNQVRKTRHAATHLKEVDLEETLPINIYNITYSVKTQGTTWLKYKQEKMIIHPVAIMSTLQSPQTRFCSSFKLDSGLK